ncbi:hypothetical protein TNIN_412081 [Trichonephila inaurata madagascariensis]|uniref:Uncharacterized protein n=1 Tax=Trichonephila inaurata madagascariensis TaxID=2747483 RepID=A0A8X6I752_9ARAC|nr:hypothetical protein TNIN_412081 [Trichonephila inaurata madagascariensis]
MRIGRQIDRTSFHVKIGRESKGAAPDESFRCTIFNAARTSGPSGLPRPQNKRYDCLTIAPLSRPAVSGYTLRRRLGMS